MYQTIFIEMSNKCCLKQNAISHYEVNSLKHFEFAVYHSHTALEKVL